MMLFYVLSFDVLSFVYFYHSVFCCSMFCHRSVYLLKSKNLLLIIVYRKTFLYGGRQENYFHIKILILVCPNWTCKKFENQWTDKVFILKMNFEKGFCIGKGDNR